jgi:hypothetical protein
MISWPLPAGTSLSNTSAKYLDTCLKVRSMASSLRWSSTSMSSWIDSADCSSSFCRRMSWSRCFVKLLYCSTAFLLTLVNLLSVSRTLCRRETTCGGGGAPRQSSLKEATPVCAHLLVVRAQVLLERLVGQHAKVTDVLVLLVLLGGEDLLLREVALQALLAALNLARVADLLVARLLVALRRGFDLLLQLVLLLLDRCGQASGGCLPHATTELTLEPLLALLDLAPRAGELTLARLCAVGADARAAGAEQVLARQRLELCGELVVLALEVVVQLDLERALLARGLREADQ